MMAAGRAAELGKRVLLLEKNARLGEKLRITGNGRCNILNAEENEHSLLSHYGKAGGWLHSSFAQFGMCESYDFFESRGLPLIVEEGNRAFPKSEKASDVYHVLEKYMRDHGVEVKSEVAVTALIGANGVIEKVLAGTKEFTAKSYILATGGMSHPETGSTGEGFLWLKATGHNVKDPTPNVVPLAVAEKWVRNLSGVTLQSAKITFYCDGQKKFSRKGRILFTHFGLSGPLIMNSSQAVSEHLGEGEVTARIDLFPELDHGALDTHIMKIFDENKNKTLKNIFPGIAPDGTADAILALTNIDLEKKVHSVSREERKNLVQLLKSLTLTISGLMGFDRAVVADGGLALSDVEPRTMKSRRYKNLFITGDLFDITRPSGGYSLQLCWTTGFVAGSNIL